MVATATGNPVAFTLHLDRRGRPFWVPDRLSDLTGPALREVAVLPINLQWSERDKSWDLREIRQRATVMETTLREGEPRDIARYVTAEDLVEAWAFMLLPVAIRAAWEPLVREWSNAA